MKVAIIGCGLIGGSIGLAIKENMGWEITGIGRDMERLNKALMVGAVDHITVDFKEGLRDADIVIVATPVKAILEIIPKLSPHLKDGAIITDVGSTKEKITYALTDLLRKGVHFVGGHPMAGGHSSGVGAARGDLFCGRVCILTPIPNTDKEALSFVRSMWERMGARVIEMSPSRHDQLIGLTSHLPHLVAMELVGLVSEYDSGKTDLKSLIGEGFRDMTRIAKSSPDMWRDICLTNREVLISILDRFRKRIDHLSSIIKDGAEREIWEEFSRAREWRSGIS
jgi:prephenate dehydrogenase